MMLTACGTTKTIEIYTDVSCIAFDEITYSALHDTDETIKQIREHNAAYKSLLCPNQ